MPKSHLVVCGEVLAHAANFHVETHSNAEHILVGMRVDYEWQDTAQAVADIGFCERCGYPDDGKCACM